MNQWDKIQSETVLLLRTKIMKYYKILNHLKKHEKMMKIARLYRFCSLRQKLSRKNLIPTVLVFVRPSQSFVEADVQTFLPYHFLGIFSKRFLEAIIKSDEKVFHEDL